MKQSIFPLLGALCAIISNTIKLIIQQRVLIVLGSKICVITTCHIINWNWLQISWNLQIDFLSTAARNGATPTFLLHKKLLFWTTNLSSGPPEADGEAELQRSDVMPVLHRDEQDVSGLQHTFQIRSLGEPREPLEVRILHFHLHTGNQKLETLYLQYPRGKHGAPWVAVNPTWLVLWSSWDWWGYSLSVSSGE